MTLEQQVKLRTRIVAADLFPETFAGLAAPLAEKQPIVDLPARLYIRPSNGRLTGGALPPHQWEDRRRPPLASPQTLRCSLTAPTDCSPLNCFGTPPRHVVTGAAPPDLVQAPATLSWEFARKKHVSSSARLVGRLTDRGAARRVSRVAAAGRSSGTCGNRPKLRTGAVLNWNLSTGSNEVAIAVRHDQRTPTRRQRGCG